MYILRDLRPYQIVSLREMLQTHGFFVFLLTKVTTQFSERIAGRSDDDVVIAETREIVKTDFPAFQEYCQHLNLSSVADQMKRILDALNLEGCTYRELKALVPDLVNRVNDDLKRAQFLYVPPSRAAFYSDVPQFGQRVADKFAKSVADIQEASRCFAVGRYTSTVFHLMRVTESAVQYLGKRLGITLVGEKNWHNILEEVDKAIKRLPVTNSSQKARRNRFAEASAHLRMVKDAWRNDVMHPKETYTEEEAERVFRNVKDFMVHLAAKL